MTERNRLGITCQFPPSVFRNEPAIRNEPAQMNKSTLLSIPLNNVRLVEAIEQILERAEGSIPTQVCFVNADCVNLAFRDPDYMRVLNQAELTFADGIGMRLAGYVLGKPILANVNGTDLFPALCKAIEAGGPRLFLLGARPGVAERVRDWLASHFPNVCVAGIRDGFFTLEEEPFVVEQIAASRSEILLVAFGAPRQDLWIRRNLDSLGVKVAIGVGGLFDFYSGRIPRAPLWMRNTGLEWCWRWYQEPRRLCRRYLLGNPLFLARLFRCWLFGESTNCPTANKTDRVRTTAS